MAKVVQENRYVGRRPDRPSLRQYARIAAATKDCKVLVATKDKLPGNVAVRDDERNVWWSEFARSIDEDRTITVEFVMVVRYQQNREAFNDLRRAIDRYRDAAGNNRGDRLYVLVGDFGVPAEIRRWPAELLLPLGYRRALAGVGHELLLESKCRNIGKRRLLDKVVKRLRSGLDREASWYGTTGALVIQDEGTKRLQLASDAILDVRNSLNASGPANLTCEGHVGCGLIMAGMLEHFRRAGHGRAELYFHRRDDSFIRMKVGDACAIHSIFSNWLERPSIEVTLHWMDRVQDHWKPAHFVETSEPSSRNRLLRDVVQAASARSSAATTSSCRRPDGERSDGERSDRERSDGERPDGERSGRERSDGERCDGGRSGAGPTSTSSGAVESVPGSRASSARRVDAPRKAAASATPALESPAAGARFVTVAELAADGKGRLLVQTSD